MIDAHTPFILHFSQTPEDDFKWLKFWRTLRVKLVRNQAIGLDLAY